MGRNADKRGKGSGKEKKNTHGRSVVCCLLGGYKMAVDRWLVVGREGKMKRMPTVRVIDSATGKKQ